MPLNSLDLPRDVVRAFAEDMKTYFAEDNKHRRDAIAVRQLRALQDFQAPHEKKLRLSDVRELFEQIEGSRLIIVRLFLPSLPVRFSTGDSSPVRARAFATVL